MSGRTAAVPPVRKRKSSEIAVAMLPALGIAVLGGLFAVVPLSAARAQDTPPPPIVQATILRVTVRNAVTGALIPNAAVRLESETERSRSRASDISGLAAFPRISDGVYNVIVSAIGFQTTTFTNVMVAANKITNVDIQLAIRRETIVVHQHREVLDPRDTSISVKRDAQFFQDMPFNAGNKQDLSSFLLSVPGVGKDVMGRITPRGEDNVAASYYTDGFLNPDIAQGALVPFLQPAMMTGFKAITGGFAPEYGGGSGLILDADFKSPPSKRGEPDFGFGFGGGEFNTTSDDFEFGSRYALKHHVAATQHQRTAATDKSLGYLIIGSQNYTDNGAETAQTGGQTSSNYNASESLFGKLDLQLTPRAVMRGVFNFSSGRSDVINRLGLTDDYAPYGQGYGFAGDYSQALGLPNQQDAGQVLNQKDNNNLFFMQIDRQMINGGHLLIGVGGGISDLSYYNQSYNAQAINSLPQNNSVEFLPTVDQNYNQIQAQIDYTAPAKKLHQFKYGAVYQDLKAEEQYQYVPQSQIAEATLVSIDPRLGTQTLNGSTYSPLLIVNRIGYFAGAYFQDTWKMRPNMTLNWGGRFDVYSQQVGSGDFNTSTGEQSNPGSLADVNKSEFSPRVNFAFAVPQGGPVRRGRLGKLIKLFRSQPTVIRLAYDHLFTPPGMGQGAYLGNQNAEGVGGTRSYSGVVPQSTDQIDLSMERQLTPTRILRLGYFNKDIRNYLQTEQLVPGVAGGMTAVLDQGHAVVDGIEATLDLLPINEDNTGYRGFVTLSSSNTRPSSDGQINMYGASLGATQPGVLASQLELDQETTISAGFSYRALSGVSAGVSVYYGSGLYASELKYPAFSERVSSRQPINEINLRLSSGPSLLKKHAWLQLDVENLTDSRARMTFQDAFAGTRFQQGRRALLSLNGKF